MYIEEQLYNYPPPVSCGFSIFLSTPLLKILREVGLKVRLAQLPIEGDWENCVDMALEAASVQPVPDVLLLPELFTIGFVLNEIPQRAVPVEYIQSGPFSAAAREKGICIIAGTFPVNTSGGIVNMLPVYDRRGRLIHTTEKAHLFRNMGEDTVFVPGTPAGVFDLCGVTSAAAVCYDLRFPELFRDHALAGAKLFFIPAQWPKRRNGLFRSYLMARAGEAQVFVAGCNLGGDHLGETYQGGGGIASPEGVMLEGEEPAEYITDYDVLPELVDATRKRIDCLSDRRPEIYGGAG